MYKTVPASLNFPNEQEYVLPFAVSGMREYQYGHAHKDRLSSENNPSKAWVVSGARIHKHYAEQGWVITDYMKKHFSTQEAAIKEFFYIYVVVDKSNPDAKNLVPGVGARYSFQFEGSDENMALDAKFPWEGVVVKKADEDQSLVDFAVFVKKPRGARFLSAYDNLREAQAKNRGMLCRLHAKLNIKVLERELLVLLEILRTAQLS